MRRFFTKAMVLALPFLAAAILLLVGSDPAMATSSVLNAFNTLYPASRTGANASCATCHLSTGGTGGGFNAYGRALAEQRLTLAATAAFRAIEGFNSDNDSTGATNLAEINASSQPGWTLGAKNTTYDLNLALLATNQSSPLAATVLLDPTTTSANRPPVLNPIGAKSVNEGQTLAFTATATDPDGNALTFSAGGLPTGANLSPAGAFSWTPTFSQSGNYNVTITVTDNGSPAASDFEVVTITVGNVNRPPVLSPSPIGNRTVNEGQTLTIALNATDPDGDALTFTGANLPSGATLTPNGAGAATFTFTPNFTQAGSFPNVTLTVSDGALNDSETFTITVGNVNRPPVLAPIGAKTVNEGQALTFTATATDPDGNALTFSAGNLPAGATLSPAGAFSWTPSSTQAGTYNVTITVTDNGSPAQNDFEIVPITVVDVTTANRPPVLGAIGAKTVNEGQALTFTATATDPDGDALAFTGTNLPSGATLSTTGAFSWMPSFSQAGTYNVTITVTDTGGLTDAETFTVTVGNVNRPPVLSPSPIGNRTVTEGQALTIAITASDPDGGTLTFTSANLPSGATLTPNGSGAATFTWTPATGQAGSYSNVTITVSDGSLTDSEMFTITVNPVTTTTVNRPPVLTNPGNKTVTAGQLLSFTLTATDPDSNGLTFSARSLPTGATLTQGGAFSWTPTTTQAGTYNVTITVTDNGTPALSASQTFTITVQAPVMAPPPTGDFDVSVRSFTATGQVRVGQQVQFRLVVMNSGNANGQANATLVGTRNGAEVYRNSITVSAPAGGSARFTLPSYTPTVQGPITWTLTIADRNPDHVTDTTLVKAGNNPGKGQEN